jgi:hypothetical protein
LSCPASWEGGGGNDLNCDRLASLAGTAAAPLSTPTRQLSYCTWRDGLCLPSSYGDFGVLCTFSNNILAAAAAGIESSKLSSFFFGKAGGTVSHGRSKLRSRTLEYMDVPHSLQKCNFSAGTIMVNV